MEAPRYGVLMIDVSDDANTRMTQAIEATKIIREFYPHLSTPLYVYTADSTGKYGRISEVIKAFDYADILFCNTCGDEIDHLYRFVRAIAKNAGIEIVPIHELRERLMKGDAP